MQPTFTPLPSNHFDLLRLVAALMVVFTHYLRIFNLGSDPLLAYTNETTDYATLGVITFFVISGYLVTGSLRYANSRTDFIRNRILRLFPGHLMCLLVCVFVIGVLCTTLPIKTYLSDASTYLYFLNGYLYTLHLKLPGVFESNPRMGTVNGSIWTLCVEFTAYLILFLLYTRTRKYLLHSIIAALIICALIHVSLDGKGLIYYKLRPENVFLFYFESIAGTRLILFFLIGSLLSYAPVSWLRQNYLFAAAISGWVLALNTPYYALAEYFCLPYIILYVGFIPQGIIQRLYKRYIGDVSYGVYLYHAPIGQTVWSQMHDTMSGRMIPLALAIVACCALASWHLVEKPALRFKRYSMRPEGAR